MLRERLELLPKLPVINGESTNSRPKERDEAKRTSAHRRRLRRRRLSRENRTRSLAEDYGERKSWRPKFQRKLDDDIKVVSLLRILSNAIQLLDATAPTSVDDLPSLLRLADSDRVHDSAA